MKTKKIIIGVTALLLTAAAAAYCCGAVLRWYYDNQKEDLSYSELRQSVFNSVGAGKETSAGEPNKKGAASQNHALMRKNVCPVDFSALLKINPDCAGWLRIDDTPIDYPVVKAEDNEYLNLDFYREKSRSGALFVLNDANLKTPQTNVTIFGHHLRNRDVMFGSLLRYKEERFYNRHRKIFFYTPFDSVGEYEVIAAFNTKAQNDISYLQSEPENLAELVKAACDRCKKPIPDISPEDKILTLSTCDGSYGGKNGRFVVMAKRTDRKK